MWTGLGALLRFTNLGDKTPSTIELATLVFSLGNSLAEVGRDRLLSPETLLLPLQLNPTASLQDVSHHLMTESTHPPLFFMLMHLWLKLFSPTSLTGLLVTARSLSAVLGILTIPAIFGLSWLAFRSVLIAQISAALMAVSPYSLYLSQEARHYTLAILFIIASLSCLVLAIRYLNQQKPIPIRLAIAWIILNSFGIAVHYFFAFTLLVQALVLALFWWKNTTPDPGIISKLKSTHWRRIYLVFLGTAISGLCWLPVVSGISDNELTQWIKTDLTLGELIEPLLRLLAWLISMLCLLPLESQSVTNTIIFGIILALFILWLTPALIRGIREQSKNSITHLPLKLFGAFVIISLTLFLIVTYGFSRDLTLAARYHFVYFPAVIIMLAVGLAYHWQANLIPAPNRLFLPFGKPVIILTLLMSFLGSLTVVSNQGYQKSTRSDLLVAQMQSFSQNPLLIATDWQTHRETRLFMGLAFELQHQAIQPQLNPQFLLAEEPENNPNLSTNTLYQTFNQIPRPFDLWLVNFTPEIKPETHNCQKESKRLPHIDGYRYRLYHC